MISVLIITHNEEENIGQCLASVGWSDDVVVVDSFSRDRTREICEAHEVRFVEHPFDGWSQQRQWALDHLEFRNEWILSLDADEIVTPELRDEILGRTAAEPFAAYEMRFRLILWGTWARRSSHYPVWITRLYRRSKVRYVASGATDIARIDGPVGRLDSDLLHVNRKPIEDWLEKHVRYASREAEARGLESPSIRSAFSADTHIERRQGLKALWHRVPARPLVYFVVTWLFKGGFLDGRAGFRLAFLKASYEYWISIMQDERRRGSNPWPLPADERVPHPARRPRPDPEDATGRDRPD